MTVAPVLAISSTPSGMEKRVRKLQRVPFGELGSSAYSAGIDAAHLSSANADSLTVAGVENGV
jgi:hypothetical protein